MKNFEVGKEIVSLLASNEQVTWYIGNKIFPLIAVPNTTFPFVVYRRAYYTPNINKDYLQGEKVGIEMIVTAAKYEESIKIANAVCGALISQSTDIIEDIKLINCSEAFVDDTYLQRLTFEIEIKD